MRFKVTGIFFSAAAVASMAFVSGCSGGGAGSSPIPGGPASATPTVKPSAVATTSPTTTPSTPTPLPSATSMPASVTTTSSVPPGATVTIPALGGYAGSIAFPLTGIPAGETVAITSLAAAPQGAPLSLSSISRVPAAARRTPQDLGAGANIIPPFITFSFPITLTLPQTLAISITLPPSVSTSGEAFFGTAIDITNPAKPQVVFIVPGVVTGQTISFPATDASGLTFNAGDTYLLGIFEASASAVANATIEAPLASDALADSVGLNTKVSYYSTASDFPALVSSMQTLGVRHLRDGIFENVSSYNQAMNQVLDATNAKLDGTADCAGIAYYPTSTTTPANIQAVDAAIGGRMETVEGPDEIDNRGDANYVSDTLSCLPGLKAAESVPFIAPSLSDVKDHGPALGNIASLVDIGNIHRFYQGNNPGTAGFGGSTACGVYGALLWAICEADVNTPGKPLYVTETGYNSQSEVDETTQAKYVSRMFLVNLQAGIPKTYYYTLKDYTGDGFGGDGLMRSDDSLKPAFEAVKSEIAFFSDPGSGATTPLQYAVSSTTIDHQLFQKQDGTYVVALWNETSSWNPATKAEIAVPAQSITLTTPALSSTPTAVTMDDTGSLADTTVSIAGNNITVPVDDHVTLVSFKVSATTLSGQVRSAASRTLH